MAALVGVLCVYSCIKKHRLISKNDLMPDMAIKIDALNFIFFAVFFAALIYCFVQFRRIGKRYNVKIKVK